MNVITDIILLVLGAVISAAISVFLNFALGKPGAAAEPNMDGEELINPHAVLFDWTLELANRRFRRHYSDKEQKEWEKQYTTMREGVNCYQKQLYHLQEMRDRVVKGREFFTWEHAAGMCIYCTNFWVSLAVSVIMLFLVQLSFLPTVFYFLFIPFVAHLLIKKM